MAVPFNRPWSGTTDASGNLTVTLTPFAAWASSFIVAGQAQGNPIWSLFNNGLFVLPGAGPQVGLGPVRFRPQEKLTIQVQGAQPNTTVQGTLWGQQSTTNDGSDLLPEQPQSSGSVPTFANQQVIGTLQAGTGATVGPQTIPVPAGTQAIGFIAYGLFFFTPARVEIQGAQTSTDYINTTTPGVFQPDIAALGASDVAVNVTLVAPSSGNSKIDVIAFPYFAQTPAPIAWGITQPAAPWQAASQPPKEFSISLAAAGVQHIIPGVAGKTIYLHHIFAAVSAAGAFAGNWQDTAGTPNLVSSETLQNGGPRLLSFAGAPLTGGVGVGLDFNVTNTGVSFYIGHVAYSQQ